MGRGSRRARMSLASRSQAHAVSWIIVSVGRITLRYVIATMSCLVAQHARSEVVHSSTSFLSGQLKIHIDEYHSKGANPSRTAIVMLCGSGGLESPAMPYRDEATALAERGYDVYVPHYLDATSGSVGDPASKYPLWVSAVNDAIGSISGREQSARIVLLGYSLGASVALAQASRDPRVSAVVDWSGSLPDEYARAATALPPILILHGESDATIPIDDAVQLTKLCEVLKSRCEFHVFPRESHEFSPGALRSANQFIWTFLERISLPASTEPLVDPSGLLRRAMNEIAQAMRNLPRFACTEDLTRKVYGVSRDDATGRLDERLLLWQDSSRVQVAFFGGAEKFAWPGQHEFAYDGLTEMIGGPATTGQFGPFIISVFLSDADRSSIHLVGLRTEAGLQLEEYKFLVPLASSHYLITSDRGGSVPAEYSGSFLIDSNTGHLKRLTIDVAHAPPETEVSAAGLSIDYAWTRIADFFGVIPASSTLQLLSTSGSRAFVWNQFSGCRAFTSKSKLLPET